MLLCYQETICTSTFEPHVWSTTVRLYLSHTLFRAPKINLVPYTRYMCVVDSCTRTQISRRRQRRRAYARFTVAARVVYSTLHSARTTHTHARPALCTRAQTCVLGTKNSVSSLCTLRLVLRLGPGFHLQRVYLWHLLRENVMHPASWWAGHGLNQW